MSSKKSYRKAYLKITGEDGKTRLYTYFNKKIVEVFPPNSISQQNDQIDKQNEKNSCKENEEKQIKLTMEIIGFSKEECIEAMNNLYEPSDDDFSSE